MKIRANERATTSTSNDCNCNHIDSSSASAASFLAVQAQAGQYRTEQYLGTEFIVVPVVALIEGVIQGVTADQPELALAEEFGRFASSWNGRPVTIDHPFVKQQSSGDAEPEIIRVSASSTPKILDDFQVGYIFNTSIKDGTKLTCEAWLDPTRMVKHSKAAKALLARIRKGEQVEVSTGLFTNAEESRGTFNSKEYFSVWRNIVPDHLALLPGELVGACSIEDGCGVYANSLNPKHNTIAPKFNAAQFLANSLQHSIMDSDVRDILQSKLDEDNPNSYTYLIGFTPKKAVYSKSGGPPNYSRTTHQQSYRLDDDKKTATFAGDEEKVRLTSTVTPQEDQQTTGSTSSGSIFAHSSTNETQETSMTATDIAAAAKPKDSKDPKDPKDPKKKTDDEDEMNDNANATATPDPKPLAAAAAAAAAPPPKPLTASEYLAAAPPEIRESLEAGLRMHTSHKAGLVKSLLSNSRNKFTEQQLQNFDVQTLENLAELGRAPDYSGMAPAGISAQTAQPQIADADSEWAAPPPRLNSGSGSGAKQAASKVADAA